MSPAKKGLHPLAWVGIGCGALVVLGVVVFAGLSIFVFSKVKDAVDQPITTAAKAIAMADPDIEFVSADEAEKTVVFRDKETGEQQTFDFSDVKDGKVVFSSSSQGTVSVDAGGGKGQVEIRGPKGETARLGAGDASDIPDFVPRFEPADYTSAFSMTTDGVTSGTASLTSSAAPASIAAFYKSELETTGWEVSETTVSTDGVAHYSVTGTKGDSHVSVTVWDEGKGAQGAVTYSGNG